MPLESRDADTRGLRIRSPDTFVCSVFITSHKYRKGLRNSESNSSSERNYREMKKFSLQNSK